MTDQNLPDPWYLHIFRVQRLHIPVGEAIKNFTKWFFDFLKNIMVAAGIAYLAKKTGSAALKAVGDFATSLLVSYFFFSIITYLPSILAYKKDTRHFAFNVVVGIFVIVSFYGLWHYSPLLIDSLILEISNAQGK